MEKYKVEAYEPGDYKITIICFSVLGGLGLILAIVIANFDGTFALAPLLLFIISAISMGCSIASMNKYRDVLDKQINSFGKVTSIGAVVRSGKYSKFKVEYTYNDEFNTRSICVAVVQSEYYVLFSVGQTIPIIVGGKYSYPDVETMKQGYRAKQTIVKEVVKTVPNKIRFKTCSYCGGRVKETDYRCPYCSGGDFE